MSLLEQLGYATMEEFEKGVLEETEELRREYMSCDKRLSKIKRALCALMEKGASNLNEEEAGRLKHEGILIEAEFKELRMRHTMNKKKRDCLALERYLEVLKEEIKLREKQKEGIEEKISQVQRELVIDISSTDERHDETTNKPDLSATSRVVFDVEDKEGDLERHELEYVQMKIGESHVLAMIDSGASHNFMSEHTARRLGLMIVPMEAQIKTVNSPPMDVLGMAEGVIITLGTWTGEVDFTIVGINDYEAVLGMEFMKQYEVMVVPHLKKLFIYNG